jgi:hypothetical protein
LATSRPANQGDPSRADGGLTAAAVEAIVADVNAMIGTQWEGNDASYDRRTGRRRRRSEFVAPDITIVVMRVPGSRRSVSSRSRASDRPSAAPINARHVLVADQAQQARLERARMALETLLGQLAGVRPNSVEGFRLREDLRYAELEAGETIARQAARRACALAPSRSARTH